MKLFEKYLDFWEVEFDNIQKKDKRLLGFPFLCVFWWIFFGLTMPTIIIPLKYWVTVKLAGKD